MQGEKRERWMELCEQAAVEQDPKKLLKLVKQINDLLQEKERRLGILPPKKP
jgi:phage shock protein A